MAIVQISQITNRKGLAVDLPQLAGAELGWSTDTRQLFIGNGTLEDGAPVIGNTELLTEFSDILNVSSSYTYKGTAAGYIVQTGPTPASPVTQTLQQFLDQHASVKDFGAMGDGSTDDTAAINRALNQLYCQPIQSPGIRRSLFFPAGVYVVSDSINIPSYATLIGEGANNSIIQLVSNSGAVSYVAQTADNLQNTGVSILTAPTNITVSNMAFQSLDPVSSVFLVQSAKSCRFQNVSFIGATTGLTTDAAGTHGVGFGYTASLIPNNIIVEACAFSNTVWGVQSAETIRSVVINNSSFNTLYQGVNLSTGATGVRVTNNVFDNIYAEGVKFGDLIANTPVNLNATGYNIFYNVGNNNVTGTGTLTPATSIINIYGTNISIGDMFARDNITELSYPRVKLNNTQSIATSNGAQLNLGSYVTQSALVANINASGTITSTDSAVNAAGAVIVTYSIVQGANNRIGQLQIAGNVITDTHTESASTGISFTGSYTVPLLINYTNSGNAATMKYSISYFDN